MKIPKTANSEQLADILGVVVDDYLERRSRGEHPEIEQIARQHPELADVIRQSLRALEVVGDTYSAGGNVSHEADFGREKRLGDFRILNELGRGGMGVVYVAEQISMGRKVALKILPFAGIVDQKQLQRFRNEVRAAASLDHPNIVSVYSFGEERGIHFYAMQLIHGQNLATIIDQLRELRRQALPLSGSSFSDALSASTNIQPATGNTEPTEDLRVEVERLRDAQVGSHAPGSDTVVEVQGLLSTKGSPRLPEYFRSVAEIGIQAAEALEHAHQQGVVHRDIKPANLMLDANAKLVITDFGLAQMEENVGITMTGDIVGTLRYMSPEQALGNRVTIDHRADIYSLGVSLYELLTIEPAFDGETRGALLKQVAFQEPRQLRQIDRTIPRDLETIIHKAIAKDPNERYSSAQQMADDLNAFRMHQPITARPPSVVDRSRKWVFRNQGLVLAVAIVMLLTILGLAISNSLIASQRNAAQSARAATQAALDGEKKQLEEAEKQAEIAKAVIKFLKDDLLGQASPNENLRDSKLTVDELVDRAALKLDDKFSKQPHVRESLRFTIGNIYYVLGKYDQAQPFLEKAMEFQKTVAGDDDKVTREYMNMLAINYQGQGTFGDRAESLHQSNFDYVRRTGRNEDDFAITTHRNLALLRQTQERNPEAIALLEQAVYISRRVHGEEHDTTLSNAAELTKIYYDGLRFEDARLLAEKTLEIADRVLKTDSGNTNTICFLLNTLALLHKDHGRFEQAMALRERIKESQSNFFGPDHPRTLEYQSAMARLLQQQGKLTESAALFEVTVESMKRILGETHPLTLKQIMILADAYGSLNELEKAEELLLECLQTQRRLLGEESPDTLETMRILAKAYSRQSKHELCQSMLQQAFNSSRKAFGDEATETIFAKCWLGYAYFSGEKLDEAEPLLLESLKSFARIFGKDHGQTLECTTNLGHLYAKKGEYEKARTFHETALAGRKRQLGNDHPDILYPMTQLAIVYLKSGQVDMAKSLFVEAVDLGRKTVGGEVGDVFYCMAHLARFYRVVGQPDQALMLFQEALESQRKLLGEERAQTLISKQFLGRLYLDQGEFDKAQPLLAEVLKARRSVLGNENSDTFASMDEMAQLMFKQNKHVEAETLFRECLALREVKHPDRWMTFRTRSLLGTALLSQKKFAEAEPFIIDGCAGLKRREDKIPYDERSTLPDSIQRAVDLYTEWDRPVEAQKWQKRLPPPTQPAK